MTNDIATDRIASSLQAALLQLASYAVRTLHANLAVLLSQDIVQSKLGLCGQCVLQKFYDMIQVSCHLQSHSGNERAW
jgi:hypothetical protein